MNSKVQGDGCVTFLVSFVLFISGCFTGWQPHKTRSCSRKSPN